MWVLQTHGLPAPRTGLDSWCLHGLHKIGITPIVGLPGIILFVLTICWAWLHWRQEAPEGLPTWTGMIVESCLYALLLWGMYYSLQQWLPQAKLRVMPTAHVWIQSAHSVSYLGAGLFEETLFRLVLFGSAWGFLRWLVAPLSAFLLAASASSVLFAYAHHLGPMGEAWEPMVFSFRCLAGMFFCVLFALRGYGVSVSTHACYDVLVGLAFGH